MAIEMPDMTLLHERSMRVESECADFELKVGGLFSPLAKERLGELRSVSLFCVCARASPALGG